MFFKCHKASLSRSLLVAMVPFFALFNQLQAEQISIKKDPVAENWYQVEVILFDQNTVTTSESAPKYLQIGFPDNWLILNDRYPNVGVMRRPIFDSSSTASLSQPENTSLTQRLSVLLGTNQNHAHNYNDGSTLIPEASIPYQNNQNVHLENSAYPQDDALKITEKTAAVEEIPVLQANFNTDFTPVYEQPFQRLNKKFRDLNDTARGLNRRKYNVHFHEAWRFQIDSKKDSPWVLVKTKQAQADRQHIEGTLRFYKSRYLHFESNLWRINFSPTDTLDIVLPDIPQTSLNSDEESLLKTLRFSKKLSSLVPNSKEFIMQPMIIQTDNVSDRVLDGIEDTLKGYNLKTIIPLLGSINDSPEKIAETTIRTNYPIKEIWPIKQSKRLQEDEVYYIDHPYMGALVTIKAYVPSPINMPPQKDELIETSELETIN